jgi:predicted RNA polymerase sigma factor
MTCFRWIQPCADRRPFSGPASDACHLQGGVALVTAALPRGPTGPYQLQAAIAAVHDEADTAEGTDWAQIAALYGVRLRLDDNPVVALNHAVAVSMVAGPRAGLTLLQGLEDGSRMTASRRFHAVRAHLLEQSGDRAAALVAYQTAARYATNTQQQRPTDDRLPGFPVDHAGGQGESGCDQNRLLP